MATKRTKTARTAMRGNPRRPVAKDECASALNATRCRSRPVETIADRLGPRFDRRPKPCLAAGRVESEAGGQKIFTEQMSGAVTDRPALQDALEFARSGDTLIVWKLDRLAWSMRQLIETIENLRVRGIGFRSLTETLDTMTAQGRLVFHMFGALAEFERSLIRERTQAGLAAARAAPAAPGGDPQNLLTTTSRPQRRCWPIPTLASRKSRIAAACLRRRSTDISPPPALRTFPVL